MQNVSREGLKLQARGSDFPPLCSVTSLSQLMLHFPSRAMHWAENNSHFALCTVLWNNSIAKVSLYLSASSPELPLEEFEFHLDSYSWAQNTYWKQKSITFNDAQMWLTCNNRRLSVIQELNGCTGQDHALVFQSWREEGHFFKWHLLSTR